MREIKLTGVFNRSMKWVVGGSCRYSLSSMRTQGLGVNEAGLEMMAASCSRNISEILINFAIIKSASMRALQCVKVAEAYIKGARYKMAGSIIDKGEVAWRRRLGRNKARPAHQIVQSRLRLMSSIVQVTLNLTRLMIILIN